MKNTYFFAISIILKYALKKLNFKKLYIIDKIILKLWKLQKKDDKTQKFKAKYSKRWNNIKKVLYY